LHAQRAGVLPRAERQRVDRADRASGARAARWRRDRRGRVTGPVQIAHAAPTSASTATVNRLHDLDHSVAVVVYPTPGRGGEGIARDVLQALGKRFRDRTPRDPRRLRALAAIWLRAQWARELVIAAADRRPESGWRLLRD